MMFIIPIEPAVAVSSDNEKFTGASNAEKINYLR